VTPDRSEAASALASSGSLVGRWVFRRLLRRLEEHERYPGPLEDFDPKTGETYRITEDGPTIRAATAVEEEAWWRAGLGDGSANRRYDQQSRVVVAEHNGRVIGISRIFQRGEQELPALSEMRFYSEEERARLAGRVEEGRAEEFGILARDVEHSTKRRTALHMFRIAYRDARNRGVEEWLIIMEPPRVRRLNRWYGTTFEQLGPTIWYQGGECAAHVLRFAGVEERALARPSRRTVWFGLKPLMRPPAPCDG
jgi:hypothetical protein